MVETRQKTGQTNKTMPGLCARSVAFESRYYDKNNDKTIDYQEFCMLLKDMRVNVRSC